MSNMDSIEITGISVDEAVKEALEQLGASETEVDVEVLATPRAGLLGVGARYAKVRVTRKGAAGANVQKAPPPAQPQARNERSSDGRPRGRENQRRGRNDGRAQSQNPPASAGDDGETIRHEVEFLLEVGREIDRVLGVSVKFRRQVVQQHIRKIFAAAT